MIKRAWTKYIFQKFLFTAKESYPTNDDKKSIESFIDACLACQFLPR